MKFEFCDTLFVDAEKNEFPLMAFRGFKKEEVFYIIKCRNNEKLALSDREKIDW